jgi:hypothetical protein
MKCSYHPTEESAELCSTCSKALCTACAHQIKNKFYCQDCLVRGAEWAASLRDLRVPTDAPKRAALCALIPGMGAVYNSDYLKGLTFFAVFAALVMMGDRIHDVFGFGAFSFLVFTMFDAYRSAQVRTREQLSGAPHPLTPVRDRGVMTWGFFLIGLGVILLLQNFISFHFLNRFWPAVFIVLGIYLVYYYLRDPGNKDANQLKTGGEDRNTV